MQATEIVADINKFITQAYSSVRYKSKRRGDKIPDFSKQELREWLFENKLNDLWQQYVSSEYDINKKPSIDRIDDYKGYEFSNMQLITWRENLLKGVNGIKHHRNCKNEHFYKPVFVWNKSGRFIGKFENQTQAAEFLSCHITSISRCIVGKRKTIKKHILTNTELTIK